MPSSYIQPQSGALREERGGTQSTFSFPFLSPHLFPLEITPPRETHLSQTHLLNCIDTLLPLSTFWAVLLESAQWENITQGIFTSAAGGLHAAPLGMFEIWNLDKTKSFFTRGLKVASYCSLYNILLPNIFLLLLGIWGWKLFLRNGRNYENNI